MTDLTIDFVTRAEWGAAPPDFVVLLSPMPTDELWLHHTAGEGEDEHSMRAIQAFHQGPEREWSDIAYHFVLDNDAPDVDVFVGRGAGVQGGATFGHNEESHAICVMGNFNDDVPTPLLLERLAYLVAYGHQEGWWPLGFTGGHRDTRGGDPKDCPGDNLYAMIGAINLRAKEIFAASKEDALTPAQMEELKDYIDDTINAMFTRDEAGTSRISRAVFQHQGSITTVTGRNAQQLVIDTAKAAGVVFTPKPV